MNEEQVIYARWLAIGVRVGFIALVVSFTLYITGVLPPGIEPSRLPQYWGLSVKQYVAATGAPTGWSWLRRLGEGDMLNFAGVAVLGGTTLLCYLRMLPVFLRGRHWLVAAICVAEIVVLGAAASGMLYSTH